MVNRFTEQAQKALELARSSAKELGAASVGTEHMLLGLTAVGSGIACEVLKESGIQENVVSDIIRKYLLANYSVLEFTGFEYTPMLNRVLTASLEKARLYKSTLIGTEHILLGILAYPNCSGCRILTTLGVSLEHLHLDVVSLIQNGGKAPAQGNAAQGQHESGPGTPTLDEYSRDITKLAQEGKLDPVVGRDREISRVIQILSRRTKNNPCLIGEPGVGKTAIAEGLAIRIVSGNVPETILGKRLVSLDLSGMVAGSKYRGEFEERIKKVIKEVSENRSVMLFIDEIHTIIGAGGAEGALDAANIIKPALSRGELQIIGATTISEYRKHIEKDAALERRFQPVMIEEPGKEESLDILKGLRKIYEDHHHVEITDEALAAAVTLSERYISDRFLPDKAIDLIDEASSKIRLSVLSESKEIQAARAELDALEQEKEQAILSQDFELAGEIKKKQERKRKRLEKLEKADLEEREAHRPKVTKEDIADIVSGWTKIPVKSIQESEAERLKNMEELLHKRVVGQEEAVKAISKAIRRGRVGLKDPKRPIGSFLFLGPTGVGKTELSKALSEVMFGTEQSIIRVDMSEYMEKHSVSKLIGSPPGYVGFEEGGQLSEKVRRNPYSVILFDEIEKAHPDVFNILLQVLDDGQITDSQGRRVDFKNTVIIMTSNCGAESIVTPKTLGFSSHQDDQRDYQVMKDHVMEAVKRTFRPEFLNRIDEIIVFHPLTKENMSDIVNIMVKDLAKRALAQMNLTLRFSPSAKQLLTEKGYDPKFGARPLRRAVQNLIEDELAEKLLQGEFNAGDTVRIGKEKDEITFTKSTAKEEK